MTLKNMVIHGQKRLIRYAPQTFLAV